MQVLTKQTMVQAEATLFSAQLLLLAVAVAGSKTLPVMQHHPPVALVEVVVQVVPGQFPEELGIRHLHHHPKETMEAIMVGTHLRLVQVVVVAHQQ